MNVKGLIYQIGETVQVSEKFKKRDFILQIPSEYTQHISLQLSQDKCGLIDNYKVAQEINCHINLRGRLWKDPKTDVEKCFNTLEVWRIETGVAQVEQPKDGKAEGDLQF